MFRGCTSLTEIELKNTRFDGGNAGVSMFENCSNLSSIKVALTSWSNYTSNWVKGVAATGTFYKLTALPEEFGTNRIPEGWTVVNIDAPSQPEDTPQEGNAYKVDGAGTTAVNGTYVENGTYNGYPQYEYVSGDKTYKLQYINSAIGWVLTDGNTTYYTGKGGTTPDTVTSWSVGLGAAPVPTFEKVASGGDDSETTSLTVTSSDSAIAGTYSSYENVNGYPKYSKEGIPTYYIQADSNGYYEMFSPTGMSMYFAPTQGTPAGKYTLGVGGTSGAEPTVTKI
jgi:hypothetical protein